MIKHMLCILLLLPIIGCEERTQGINDTGKLAGYGPVETTVEVSSGLFSGRRAKVRSTQEVAVEVTTDIDPKTGKTILKSAKATTTSVAVLDAQARRAAALLPLRQEERLQIQEQNIRIVELAKVKGMNAAIMAKILLAPVTGATLDIDTPIGDIHGKTGGQADVPIADVPISPPLMKPVFAGDETPASAPADSQ